MRKYVLPYFGFTFKEDEKMWVNSSFPDEDLRIIKDDNVQIYYSRLTAKMIFEFGKSKFMEWAKSTDYNITEQSVDQILKGVDKKE